MSTGASWPSRELAERPVLAMQTELHRWAVGGSGRRFDDLYNLVDDPAFLVVAWTRVRATGAHEPRVNGIAPKAVGGVTDHHAEPAHPKRGERATQERPSRAHLRAC